MKRIRVLIVDDNDLIRNFVRSYLEHQDGFEVVGEACDGVEVVYLTQVCRPEVVLMDISMPHKDGLAATADLSRECPQVRVIMMSSHDDTAYVQQAIRAGAVGYLVKPWSINLEVVITAIANGQTYFDPAVSQSLLHCVPPQLRDHIPGRYQKEKAQLK